MGLSTARNRNLGAYRLTGGTGWAWLRLWGGRPPTISLLLLAGGTAAAMAIPLLYLVVRALTGNAATWASLWYGRLPMLLANTLALALASTGLAVLIGVPLAWLVVRTDLPGRRAIRWLGAMPLVYPAFVGSLGYIAVFGPRGLVETELTRLLGQPVRLPSIYGLGGTALMIALFTYPYLYLLTAAALGNLNQSLEEAARTAGHRGLGLFRRVTLPLIRPAVGAGALMVAFHALAEFGTVALMRYDTFTSAIFLQLLGRFDPSRAAALSLVLVLLTGLVLVLEQRSHQQARYHQNSGTWRPAQTVALGHWKWPALLFVALVMAASLGLPTAMLLYWTGQALVRGFDFNLAHYAWSTLSSSAVAAALATALAFPIAYLRARSDGPGSRWLYLLSYSGYALPGVVIALAMTFLFNRWLPGLYGTLWVMVAAYVVRFMPESLGAQQAALAQISPAVEDASRLLGHSFWATMRRVTLPLSTPGLVAGWAMVFLNALKELPATLLLRPVGYDTLAVRVWIPATDGFYPQSGPPALLLILLALPPAIVLVGRTLQGRVKEEPR